LKILKEIVYIEMKFIAYNWFFGGYHCVNYVNHTFQA